MIQQCREEATPEDHPAQPNGAPLRSARLEVSGDLLPTGAVVRGYPVTLGDCVSIKPDNTVSSLKTEVQNLITEKKSLENEKTSL